MTEHEQAKAWRLRHNMNVIQLSEALGYSREALWLFEKGAVPKGRKKPIQPWTWQRYKRACGDLDAELNGRKKGETFQW